MLQLMHANAVQHHQGLGDSAWSIVLDMPRESDAPPVVLVNDLDKGKRCE